MGKRSDFAPKALQKYYTPYEAVVPLFPHLPLYTKFIEPCAGDGRLVRHLERGDVFECVYACDISPDGSPEQNGGIVQRDVLFFDSQLPACDMIITNPPWDRELLHPMIQRFVDHAPTWLLFDADWMHTAQARPYKHLCSDIVSIGRVSWEGNGVSGMDNCCWYKFDKGAYRTQFHFRQ